MPRLTAQQHDRKRTEEMHVMAREQAKKWKRRKGRRRECVSTCESSRARSGWNTCGRGQRQEERRGSGGEGDDENEEASMQKHMV